MWPLVPSATKPPHMILPAGASARWQGGAVLQAGQAGPCPATSSPRCPGLAEGRVPVRTEETLGMGEEPSPASLLGSGTEQPLPGYGASLLHQQIARIPSLQELPGAPRKGEAKTEPRPRLFQSLEGPQASSDPEL